MFTFQCTKSAQLYNSKLTSNTLLRIKYILKKYVLELSCCFPAKFL